MGYALTDSGNEEDDLGEQAWELKGPASDRSNAHTRASAINRSKAFQNPPRVWFSGTSGWGVCWVCQLKCVNGWAL